MPSAAKAVARAHQRGAPAPLKPSGCIPPTLRYRPPATMDTVLPPADRFSDHRTADPYWNESVWFSISKPQEHLHGLIQYYFRPNMGMLNGGPVIWDPSGT